MRYLLDTCVLSDFAGGEPRTLARVKETRPADVAISTVTVMEVHFGLALAPERARSLAPVMRALMDAASVLPYEIEDARATATLRAALQKAGHPIGAYDAMIAGCAIARGLVLVTANEKEFARASGLELENWRSL